MSIIVELRKLGAEAEGYPVPWSAGTGREVVERARALRLEDRLIKALECLEDGDEIVKCARTLRREGHYQEALECLDAGKDERCATNFKVLSEMGLANFALRRREEALDNFERALQEARQALNDVEQVLSAVDQDQGGNHGARDIFLQAHDLLRKSAASILVSLSNVTKSLGDHRQSLACADAARKYDPGNWVPYLAALAGHADRNLAEDRKAIQKIVAEMDRKCSDWRTDPHVTRYGNSDADFRALKRSQPDLWNLIFCNQEDTP